LIAVNFPSRLNFSTS